MLVTIDAPRTAKLCAEPSGDGADAETVIVTESVAENSPSFTVNVKT